MAEKVTNVGNDPSFDIRYGQNRQVLLSHGLDIVHVHPDPGFDMPSVNFNPRVLETLVLRISYTLGSDGFDVVIPGDRFEIINVGSEQLAVEVSRAFRDVQIRTTLLNSTTENISEVLTLNFTNYMAVAEITINQGRAPGVTALFASGGGLTGTVNAADTNAISRAQLQGSGTMTLLVSGDEGATYRIVTDNTALVSDEDFGTTVYTIDSTGFRTHEVTVADVTFSTLDAIVTLTHAVTSEMIQLFLEQVGENQASLTITPTSTLTPVRGFQITYDFGITGADPGVGVLQRSNQAEFTTVIVVTNVTVASDGTANGSNFITPLAQAERYFRFVDSSGVVSPVQSFNSNPGTPTLTATSQIVDWNDTSQQFTFGIDGLSLEQKQSLSAGLFSITESNDIGAFGGGSYVTNSGTAPAEYAINYGALIPNVSISASLDSTLTLTLTVLAQVYRTSASISKTARPENPVTFPTHSVLPGILNTATAYTFLCRYDSTRNTLTLTDASGTDDDIWAEPRLMAATIVNQPDPELSSNQNDLDFYLSDSLVTLDQGAMNLTTGVLTDMIDVTSS